MSKERSKSWTERSQQIFGVTKNELIVAATILAITLASLGYRWIANPADPLDERLNAALRHTIDSVTAARRAAQVKSTDSSLSLSDTSGQLEMVFKAPSRYGKKTAPERVINLNTASKDDLKQLPGVGEKMAKRILESRAQKKFKRVEDLMKIRGIGDKMFEKMKEYVVVE